MDSAIENDELFHFCKAVPKVELHAHLNGSIRTETINELCAKKHIPHIRHEHANSNLKSCFELFKVITQLTTDNETINRITIEMIEDCSNDNVKYLEIRTSPKTNGFGMTKKSYVESVVAAIDECKDKYQCLTYLLLSINREETLESAMETVALARDFPGHVRGIDFSGNPTKGSFEALLPALEYAKKLGYKTAVHFAEVENIAECNNILDFVPARLGHATCMNDKIQKRVIDSKIPVEICMTSNVTSQSVASYYTHHFKELHALSHPLSLCTDDSGVFLTTLSKEYYVAAMTFSFNHLQVFNLAKDACQHIFATERAHDLKDIFHQFYQKTTWQK